MSETRYAEDHEWVQLNNGIATIGITDHAQKQLGEIVSVDLPDVGQQVEKGDEVAVIDSVKAASEIYAPMPGEICEVNESLQDDPGQVNSDPQGAGWFIKMTVDGTDEFDGLMDEAAYQKFVDDAS